jgi:dihydroorotate dehydrogenase
MMFVSAPFGNWVKPIGCIPVTGTYTLHARGNRVWSAIKSLRYNTKHKGWMNNMGLPNPGVKVGLERHINGEVLSIAEIERNDFKKLYREIPEGINVELNLSCPNIRNLPWDSTEIFARNSEKRKWCICKVSPTVTPEDLEFLITKLGFTQIHASNTLPIQGCGGLSGRTLIPYTLDIIRLIREEWPEVTIIAGGGVDSFGAVYEYLNEGADHVSLGSVCFNPFKLRKILKNHEKTNKI